MAFLSGFCHTLLPVSRHTQLFRTILHLLLCTQILQPLLILRIISHPVQPSKTEYPVTHPVKQKTIMGHKNKRSGELEQTCFKHIERSDIKIIGGLIQQ